MSFSLPTNQGRPVSSVIPVPLETYGYTLTAEFSSDQYFPFFTVKSVTGDGRYVNLALTAEEVDTLQSSHFRIRATKGDSSKFVSVGRLNYIQEPLGPITGPQGPAGIQGATGPVGPKGDTGPSPILPVDLVRTSDLDIYVDTIGTSSPQPNTLVRRDPFFGGSQFGYVHLANQPEADDHATRRDYVDGKVAAAGTVESDANSVVRRDQNGGTKLNWLAINGTPTNVFDVTNKQYVDGIGTTNSTANTVARRDGNGNVRFQEVFLDHVPTNTISAVRMDWVQNAIAAAARDTIIRSNLGNSLWGIGGAESCLRPANVVALTLDAVTFSMFTAPLANTITKLGLSVNTASAGLTNFQLGLYTVNDVTDTYTLVAKTANDTATTNTAGSVKWFPLSTVGGFPASYTFVPGTRYAFAAFVRGTTAPVVQSWFDFETQSTKPYLSVINFTTAGLPATVTTTQTWWNAPWLAGQA